jgi:hypothetical protein
MTDFLSRSAAGRAFAIRRDLAILCCVRAVGFVVVVVWRRTFGEADDVMSEMSVL